MKSLVEKVYGNSVCTCPWSSPNEFKLVLDNITSNDFDNQAEGIRCMDMWVQRNPRLLLAVETTLAVAKAIWLHECYKRKPEISQHLDDDHFRGLYSSAIIRFVNLITQCGQQLDYPIPITSIAKKMNIPDWIVDIRHSATHSSMPSLEVLENATKKALEWLKVEHWKSEQDLCSKYSIPEKCIPVIEEEPEEDLLVPLLEIQDYLFKAKGKNNLDKEILERLRSILITSDKNTLVSTLLCDGLFFPSFQESLVSTKLVKKKLDPRLFSWIPALQMLPKQAMKLLLLELFKTATRNDLKGQFAGEWIQFILRHIKNRRRELKFTGDESKFCLEVMKWITPKTSAYLKLLFRVFWKRSTGHSLRKFLSLSASRVSSTIEIPEIENDVESSNSESEEDEDSDSDMPPIGFTASQMETNNFDLTLPSAAVFKDLLSCENVNAIEEYRTAAKEIGLSFMGPPIASNLTQIQFDKIRLL